MMDDLSIRESYVQATIAEGLKDVGSNNSGAMAGFTGIGMGMQIGGSFMGAASNTNMQRMQMDQVPVSQPVGNQPSGSQWAVPNQMTKAQPGDGGMTGQVPGTQPSGAWFCPGCGTSNTDKFCGECGHRRPDAPWTYACRNINTGRFCSGCGEPRP